MTTKATDPTDPSNPSDSSTPSEGSMPSSLRTRGRAVSDKEKPIDPFDPATFAVSPEALAAMQGDVGVVPQLTGISVRKPRKQEFFRVSADSAFAMVAPILELEDERETYLVLPAVAATLPGDVTMRELRVCQTRQGTLFIWPVPVLVQDAKKWSAWHTSARQIMATAQKHWCRMTSDQGAGRYNSAIATGITAEPCWPVDMSMRDLLELAFGKERLITEQGHPVVKRLLGVE